MNVYQAAEIPGWKLIDPIAVHPTRENVKGALLRNIKTGVYAIACNGSLVRCPKP